MMDLWRLRCLAVSLGVFTLSAELFVHVPLACPSRQPSRTSGRVQTRVTVTVVRHRGEYHPGAPRVRLGTTACCANVLC